MASQDPSTLACVVAAIADGALAAAREHALLHTLGWTPSASAAASDGRVGALLRFEGVVRRSEPKETDGGRAHDLAAIEYETYDPMAERELLALARDVTDRHGLLGLAALHSRGRVCVGEVSFVLIVRSVHRAEALAAMSEFIHRLKQDVPIWKRPIWR